MRHTVTSRLIMASVDLPTVGEMLGNSTQLKRYTHLTDEHKKKTIKGLNAAPACHIQDTTAENMLVENVV